MMEGCGDKNTRLLWPFSAWRYDLFEFYVQWSFYGDYGENGEGLRACYSPSCSLLFGTVGWHSRLSMHMVVVVWDRSR